MSIMTYLAAFLPIYLSSFFDGFDFDPMGFVDQLGHMGIGMACIFIVMGAIIAVVMILEKVTSRSKKSDDDSSK